MAYSAKVGSFNIDSSITAGNDQSVAGVGFQPKVVLLWWSGSTASSDTVAGGTYNVGFGAASSSSSRWCVMGTSVDGQAASDTLRSIHADEVIRCYTDPATLDGVADFKSMDANGFTLTIDDQFAQDYRISYLALGGDDLTDVYLGTKQMHTTVEEYSVTGVGFQPDCLITAGTFISTLNTEVQDDLVLSVGMATGSGNQGVVAGWVNDAQATSMAYGYGYNGEVSCQYYQAYRDSFVSFDADGFTLDHLESALGVWFCYVCLAGGQYGVGDLTTRTDGNDIEEDVGFEPVAVLLASANRSLDSQDTWSTHTRLSVGAGTSASERAVQAISDESGLADTETAYANYDSAVYAHVVDDAVEALMDIKSIDADGFTCVMDDAESSACWVTYLAIGAEGGCTQVTTTVTVTVTVTVTETVVAQE